MYSQLNRSRVHTTSTTSDVLDVWYDTCLLTIANVSNYNHGPTSIGIFLLCMYDSVWMQKQHAYNIS